MTTNRSYLLWLGIASIVYCISNASISSAECVSEVTRFLSDPNEVTYGKLVDPYTRVVSDDCWDYIANGNNALQRLLKKVSAGNLWTAIFIARNIDRLDGGDLEDALIALGVSMDKDPNLLLSLHRDGIIDNQTLSSCVSQRPLSLVDDQKGTLLLLKLRKKKILSVKTPGLEDAKREALIQLDETINDIENNPIAK
jgi:hypothetical protein